MSRLVRFYCTDVLVHTCACLSLSVLCCAFICRSWIYFVASSIIHTLFVKYCIRDESKTLPMLNNLLRLQCPNFTLRLSASMMSQRLNSVLIKYMPFLLSPWCLQHAHTHPQDGLCLTSYTQLYTLCGLWNSSGLHLLVKLDYILAWKKLI